MMIQTSHSDHVSKVDTNSCHISNITLLPYQILANPPGISSLGLNNSVPERAQFCVYITGAVVINSITFHVKKRLNTALESL